MGQPRIVIITDQHGQTTGLQVKAILQRENIYQVDLNEGVHPAPKNVFTGRPDMVIPVLPGPDHRTAHLLAALRVHTAETPMLAILGSVDLIMPLDGLLPWRTDFILMPLQAGEVCGRVRRLLARTDGTECGGARGSISPILGLAQLIGEDPAFLAVKRKLPLVARSGVPVLLTSETGTGKELCARALHYLSRRAGKPFLPVNCGAIPMELFESELFGHAKGAFTGAWAAQPGLIAEADGGTLFLDEIETLPLGAQVKFLRFLQDQTYHALGSSKLRQADLRIIAATNADLAHKVREGTFREDLFYRLAVIPLTLPPLRERRADIPLLAARFLARYVDQHGGAPRQWSPRALEALCQYAWPGNVRELENVVQQVAVLSDAPTIEREDLPFQRIPPAQASSGTSFQQAKAQILAQFEQAHCAELLRRHQGNVTQAARAAQMERRAFGRMLKKYHIPKR